MPVAEWIVVLTSPIAGRLLRLLADRETAMAGEPPRILIELAAGTLALWAAWQTSGLIFAASIGLGYGLLWLSVVDLRIMRLPDGATLPLILAGLVLSLLGATGDPVVHAAGAAVGYGLVYGVAAAYRALRGLDGLGLGDAKLVAAAGAWVGLFGLPSVILWAGVLGLSGAAVARVMRRDIGWRTEIPLGPALALGLWLTWLHGPVLMGR